MSRAVLQGGASVGMAGRERARWLALSVACGLVMPWLSYQLGCVLLGPLPSTAVQIAVPAVMVLPFYPIFLTLVRRGAFGFAVITSLVWALACSLSTIPLVAGSGDEFAPVIWNAVAYRDDMFHWIETGVGQEGSPAQYIPEHARHFAGFVLLSLLSVGFAGLCLGAALLNYMNFYVGHLFANATDPAMLVLFSWPCYAIVRVVGFITAATGVTAFALRVVGRCNVRNRKIRIALWTGFGLVIVDAILKWLVAPMYREILGGAIG